MSFSILPPLCLYVHIPWCVRKCPYCDFNSHERTDELDEAAYIDALIRDLDSELPGVWGRVLHSVFIGGGTPSLFGGEAIGKLLAAIRQRFRCDPAMEVTLEANPGTAEAARFRDFHAAGVNRLSIGVQSFDDDKLAALGRIHNAAEAHRAIEFAQDAGFQQLNLDLMFGLPGQSVEAALADLDAAIRHAPTHLSHYELTIEPNTLFHHRPPPLPEDDSLVTMAEASQSRLTDAGYPRYEISAFARESARCKHNLNYWQFGDYLGLGAGAHSKLTRADSQTVERYSKLRHPQRYLESAGSASATEGRRVLTKSDRIVEYMLNALRLVDGVELDEFEQRTGIARACLDTAITTAIDRKLLIKHRHRLQPTPHGLLYLNDLLALFDFPEADES